jgi:starch phosphorylase
MAALTPRFSATRTVREYTEAQYLPAAAAYAARASQCAPAFLAWQAAIARHWKDVRFAAAKVTPEAGELRFEVEVCLGGLEPSTVRVELYAEAPGGGPAFTREMEPCAAAGADAGLHSFVARAPADRPAADFTARVRPFHPLALAPETCRIVWQR